MKDYLRCVASVDDNVGRLLDYLDETRLADDTIVIYTSDQGFFLGDHGWFDKRFMYEESLRMPLLVRYPRERPARQRQRRHRHQRRLRPDPARRSPASPVPTAMQGRSFWPAAPTAQTPADWRRPCTTATGCTTTASTSAVAHYGVRTAPLQADLLLQRRPAASPGSGPTTLPAGVGALRPAADPRELRNVYDDPSYLEVREQLKTAMWREQARLGNAPHPSQPVPAGVEDVTTAQPPEQDNVSFLELVGLHEPE